MWGSASVLGAADHLADFLLHETLDDLGQIPVEPFAQHGAQQIADDVFDGAGALAKRQARTVVAAMEGGQLTLADSLAAYKRGAELLKYCRGVLEDAQQQIKVLEGDTLRDLTGGDDGA